MLSKLRSVLFFLQILRIVEDIPKTVPVSRSASFFGREGGGGWGDEGVDVGYYSAWQK